MNNPHSEGPEGWYNAATGNWDKAEPTMSSIHEPVLPYGATNPSSGYSGTDTSAERARRDDSDGTTGKRQREALRALDNHAEVGCTWKDLADYYGWHHGQASGSLSNLHKAGLIARLSERRNRCKVYVLPEYVAGREIEPYARTERRFTVDEVVAALLDGDLLEDYCTVVLHGGSSRDAILRSDITTYVRKGLS